VCMCMRLYSLCTAPPRSVVAPAVPAPAAELRFSATLEALSDRYLSSRDTWSHGAMAVTRGTLVLTESVADGAPVYEFADDPNIVLYRHRPPTGPEGRITVPRWMVGHRADMARAATGYMMCRSMAAEPERITSAWDVCHQRLDPTSGDRDGDWLRVGELRLVRR
jgi:hypothetical protein